MADLSRTVEIVFNGVDQTSNVLADISKGANDFIDDVSGVTEPLADLAKDALAAETSILALGAAFLTVAVNEASDFNESMEEIGSLINATPKDVDELKKSVQKFAKDSVSDFDSISDAVYVTTSNVGDTSKALDILKVAEKGSQVGATSLSNAASALSRTMNAYGLVTSDSEKNTRNAERVMAALFVTVQNGDTTLEALSKNIGKVASTASAANVPIETVGAAIAAITSAGIGTEESMTLFNSLLKELLNPSAALNKALGGVSVTTDGLPAVLDKLKGATNGSAEKIYNLFSSSEAAKGALILVNDRAGKFKGTLEEMNGSVNTFNKNYDLMVGGVKDSTKKLANQTQVLLQKVGDPLQLGWGKILDGMTALLGGFELSVDEGAFDLVFGAFDEFAVDIEETLGSIAKNLPEALEDVDFTGLLDALEDLGIEIGGLFDDFDLTTPQGLAKAIKFVVQSFESLTLVVSGIVKAWAPVVSGFIDGTTAFNGLSKESKKGSGALLSLSQVFETFKGSMKGIASAADTISIALGVIAGSRLAAGVTNLAGSFAGFSTAAKLGALGVALGGVTFGVSENMKAWADYKKRQDTVTESTENLGKSQNQIKAKLKIISESTGVTVESMDDLNKAVDDGALTFNEATGEYEAADKSLGSFDEQVAAATESNVDLNAVVAKINKNLGLTDETADDVIGTFDTLDKANEALINSLKDGTTHSITYEDGLYKLHETNIDATDSSKDLAKSTDDAAEAAKVGSKEWKNVQDVMLASQKQADDFHIAMEGLANERWAIAVQADVDLKTAQIEADTQRISAALSASSEVIDALASSVANLWGAYGSVAGTLGASEIMDAAYRMEERLDEELALKRQLTEYIIAQAAATTARLNSGQPLISIDGGNLEPELEILFSKILKYTQIKATEQGLSLLVGL